MNLESFESFAIAFRTVFGFVMYVQYNCPIESKTL